MKKIAVVGSGIAGVSSAYYLSKEFEVDLFEKDARLGGHTHSVSIPQSDGADIVVDTGFIVFTLENYPHFVKFLSDLGVEYCHSDMSFSVYDPHRPFYFGSDFPRGIFSQKRHWVSPDYYQFLMGIHRFNERCLADADSPMLNAMALKDYLDYIHTPRKVILDYVLPMTSAIWSASFDESLEFPANAFIRFWKHHQLLEIGKGWQWRTIPGGSRRYLEAATTAISGTITTQAAIEQVVEEADSVRIYVHGQPLTYDGVVIATHADQALALRPNPNSLEQDLLGKWAYSKNPTVLHTDVSVMPPARSAWCSWNLTHPSLNHLDSPASVTYWMNRLQPLRKSSQFFVTLNPSRAIRRDQIIKEMTYTHPIMTRQSMATQGDLPHLNHNRRIVYAGSYFGYGFHEDAIRSAIDAIGALRLTLDAVSRD